MRNTLCALLAGTLLFSLAGCGISGRYTSSEVKPMDERNGFKIAELTLTDAPTDGYDGTYKCVADYGSGERESTGTYIYTHNKLILQPNDGPARIYKAVQKPMGSELWITTTEHGEDVTVVLERDSFK